MSATLEAGLITLFSANAAVTAAIGDRIYPLSVEKPRAPYATYEVRGGEDDFTRDGYSGLIERRVTFNCVGRDYDEGVQIAAVVKAALPLWGGTWGGVRFRMIRRDDERDYYTAEAGTVTPTGRQLDFTVKFTIEESQDDTEDPQAEDPE